MSLIKTGRLTHIVKEFVRLDHWHASRMWALRGHDLLQRRLLA